MRLKVRTLAGCPNEETRDFEQGRYLPFCDHLLILVEGQAISSYQELVQLAAEDCYREKEFLEVVITSAIGGG